MMQPLIRYFHANARRNASRILAENPLRTWLRDRILQELPPALVVRSWGRQFQAEQELLQPIMDTQ